MAFCIDRWFQQIFLDQSMGASKAATTTSRAGKVESLSSRCASTAWLNWLLKIAMGDNKLVVFFFWFYPTQHVMIERTQCGTCGKNLFSFGGSGWVEFGPRPSIMGCRKNCFSVQLCEKWPAAQEDLLDLQLNHPSATQIPMSGLPSTYPLLI